MDGNDALDKLEMLGRLPWLAPSDLNEEQKAFYGRTLERFSSRRRAHPLTDDQGRMHGPYNPMLYSLAIGEGLQQLGMALRFDGELPRLTFEAIVLTVAVTREASFQWWGHLPVAVREGLDGQLADQIRGGDLTPLRDIMGDAVFALVNHALVHTAPDDELYRKVESEIGVVGIQEVIHTVAHYDEIALMMATFAIPLPDGQTDPFPSSTAS